MTVSFAPILERATQRVGGRRALAERMPECLDAAALEAIPDDRWLAAMTRGVFRAGFAWRVVDAKWPGFEVAFDAFDVTANAMRPDEAIEALRQDRRIIRNGPKIATVPRNAAFVLEVRRTHGGFGRWVAAWPDDDVVGLWAALKQGGARLGGNTGPMMLRAMGRDTFLLTVDVCRALVGAGVVDKAPTGKRALAVVQEAFTAWRAETGRPLCELSRVLSLSLG